jgi:hypothetical protein
MCICQPDITLLQHIPMFLTEMHHNQGACRPAPGPALHCGSACHRARPLPLFTPCGTRSRGASDGRRADAAVCGTVGGGRPAGCLVFTDRILPAGRPGSAFSPSRHGSSSSWPRLVLPSPIVCGTNRGLCAPYVEMGECRARRQD